MSLRQQLCLNNTVTNLDEFNAKDGYYYATLECTLMEIFETLHSNSSHPIVVIDKNHRKIFYSNKAARPGLSSEELIHKKFDDVFMTVGKNYINVPITHIGEEWLAKTETLFNWENKSYILVEFKKLSHLPDRDTLESWKEMILVMLHRFRSPLTGISGYLEMLQDEIETSDNNSYFKMVDKGINHLYDIMDELEVLYHISSNYDESKSSTIEIRNFIQTKILSYTPDIQNRILVDSIDEDLTVSCNPSNLSRILDILLQNAIENSSGKKDSIKISVPKSNIIQVINDGSPIPDSLSGKIFHPFVTNSANNLGVGLTKALLSAQQFGGTIFLSQNNAQEGIIFSICFPK